MREPLLSLSLALTLLACSGAPSAGPAAPAACDPKSSTCVLAHDFGLTTVAPGQEIDGRCLSWTLNNPTDLWVNSVSLANDGAYHHSNWFFVPDTLYDRPDGEWSCGTLHFDELQAALVGGVLFAQSTQSPSDTQRFSAGAAVRVPAYARVVGSAHLLNVTPQTVKTGLRLSLATLPEAQVKARLAPMRLGYADLRIPPQATSEFAGRCDLRAAYRGGAFPGEFQMKLHYVLPHYHDLGSQFRLQLAGGARDGEELYLLKGGFGEPMGKTFDPPVDLSVADGLRYGCSYKNPRTEEVRWGIGDQEMCEMLGFVESPMAFDAWVRKGAAAGMAKEVALFQGPCEVSAFRSDR